MSNTNVRIFPGLPTLLTLLFVALKITGYIDWHWVWVLAPAWIYGAFVFLIVFVVLIVGAITTIRK